MPQEAHELRAAKPRVGRGEQSKDDPSDGRVNARLERAEPELAADLVDNGITLAGGGALLRGIDVVISEATGLDVRIAEDPLTCVARGTSIYLDNLELWKATLESDMDD